MQKMIQSGTFYDVQQLIETLRELDSDGVVLVFDKDGDPIQRFTLIEVELTDGSLVYNLNLLPAAESRTVRP